MQGLKIKVRRLQLFGCSLNFWRECVMYFDEEAKCVTDTSQLFGEEGAQLFVKSTIFILHFTPACILLSVCSLHFTRSLHFTHGPQSAYYAGRFENVMERGTSKNLTSLNLQTASKIFWKLNLEVLVISRRLKLPQNDQVDTRFIACPLRMHFYRVIKVLWIA